MISYRAYWDREIETMDRAELLNLQEQKLQRQMRYAYASSPFYREVFDEWDVRPESIRTASDLRRLPFTRKSDLKSRLEAAPPFSDILCAPVEQAIRTHTSSGTTGKPTPMFWTRKDLGHWSDMYARAMWAQGARPTDVYQCSWGFPWFVGGLGGMQAMERLGALSIPAGSADAKRQIQSILDYGVTIISLTPSFALYFGGVAKEMGVELSEAPVRHVICGGEPGANIPGTRQKIERLWGAKAYDGYGSLEFQPTAWDCETQKGPHGFEDHVLYEVVDPETHEPVDEGENGVLVLTHLDREAMPLVRWWTNDVVRFTTEPCSCGRTHLRLPGGVQSRVDDMLIVKGINVFPSAVEDVIRTIPGVGEEFRIVVDNDVYDRDTGNVQKLRLVVEQDDPDSEALGSRIEKEFRDRMSVSPEVELVASGTFERSTTKTNRLTWDLS
jgi:phenylacetate-CoA ligase